MNKTLLSLPFFIFILAFLPGSVFSQHKPDLVDDIKKVQTLKLIVQVPKLSEKDEQDTTNRALVIQAALKNKNIREVINKFWKFPNEGIEFKGWEEMKEMKGSNNEDYATLYFYQQKPTEKESSVFFRGKPAVNWTWCLALVEGGKRRQIYGCEVPTDSIMTKTDLLYCVDKFLNFFNERLKGSETEKVTKKSLKEDYYMDFSKLSQKTLLIRKDRLDPEVSKQQIASVYPYKFEIVSKEELDEKVMSGKPEYAFLVVQRTYASFRSTGSNYYDVIGFNHQIINNETGHSMTIVIHGDKKKDMLTSLDDFKDFLKH